MKLNGPEQDCGYFKRSYTYGLPNSEYLNNCVGNKCRGNSLHLRNFSFSVERFGDGGNHGR